jgi:hypothetical protein
MKFKILTAELSFQILLTVGSIIYLIMDYIQKDQINEIFLSMFFVGIANLVGFVIRISMTASKFHLYYFLGVIIFFLFLYLLTQIKSEMNFTINYMQIGGVLFNIYYLIYGFINVKKISNEMKTAQ